MDLHVNNQPAQDLADASVNEDGEALRCAPWGGHPGLYRWFSITFTATFRGTLRWDASLDDAPHDVTAPSPSTSP